MIVEFFVVFLLAKIKKYKLKYLFYSWTFYIVLAAQCVLVFFEISVFFDIYYFVSFASYIEPAIIVSFLFPIIKYKLYTPAIIGSASIFLGTVMNRFVIAQNGGKMPVFPSFSYVTGYVTPETFSSVDDIHMLGNASTKFKFLTDYIDYGYSILSPGDIFIHLFVCIMLCYMIKKLNNQYRGNL